MLSVSDDDVRKRLLEKPRFELAVKGVFRLGRCYIFRQGVPGLWTSNLESTATKSDMIRSGNYEYNLRLNSLYRTERNRK